MTGTSQTTLYTIHPAAVPTPIEEYNPSNEHVHQVNETQVSDYQRRYFHNIQALKMLQEQGSVDETVLLKLYTGTLSRSINNQSIAYRRMEKLYLCEDVQGIRHGEAVQRDSVSGSKNIPTYIHILALHMAVGNEKLTQSFLEYAEVQVRYEDAPVHSSLV